MRHAQGLPRTASPSEPAPRWRRSLLRCILQHGLPCFTCPMNLTLSDAFAKFGAKPANRLRALSAIAEDGAVVLSCARSYFGRPGRGVLRYEDKLSRESGDVPVSYTHLDVYKRQP